MEEMEKMPEVDYKDYGISGDEVLTTKKESKAITVAGSGSFSTSGSLIGTTSSTYIGGSTPATYISTSPSYISSPISYSHSYGESDSEESDSEESSKSSFETYDELRTKTKIETLEDVLDELNEITSPLDISGKIVKIQNKIERLKEKL